MQLAYVDQSRDHLNDKNSVWQEVSDGLDMIDVGKTQMPSRAYVGAFNFKGTDQQKKVGLLSGGERNRVHLAKLLHLQRSIDAKKHHRFLPILPQLLYNRKAQCCLRE